MDWLYDNLELLSVILLLSGLLWVSLAHPPRCIQTKEGTFISEYPPSKT